MTTTSGVVCCISPLARMGLTRLKQRRREHNSRDSIMLERAFGLWSEFTDITLSVDHPYVSWKLLARLREIDANLILCWELQHYFEHRWHIKWKDGLTGNVQSVRILQSPEAPLIHQHADFVPFNHLALQRVSHSMFILRNGLQNDVIANVHKSDRLREESRIRDAENLAADYDMDYRKIHERLRGKRNLHDPGWERGISFDSKGTPVAEGTGAHSKHHTKAL